MISRGFFLDQIWQSKDFLAMFLTSTPKKAVLSQTNSIECLICAEFLETSNRIAIFGHSQWDLRGTLKKVLGGELQTSIEDLPYVCKRKCYPKLKKIEKMMSNLKSQISKVSKKSFGQKRHGSHKAGIESRSNSGGIAGSDAGEESFISYKSTSRSNMDSFASSNGKGGYKSDRVAFYSFDHWIYSSKAFGCSCSCAGISNMCKHWEEFQVFSPARQHSTSQQLPPDKRGAANKTVSKSNLDEVPFVQVWTISTLKPLFAFSKLNKYTRNIRSWLVLLEKEQQQKNIFLT